MCVYFCFKFCCDHQVWGKRLKACTIGEDYEKGIFPVDCKLKTSHGLKSRRVAKMCNTCIRTDHNLKRMAMKLQDCRRAFAEKWPEYDLDKVEESSQVQSMSDYDRFRLEKDAEACSTLVDEVTEEIDAYERGDSEKSLLEKGRRNRQKRDSGRDSGIGLNDDSSDAASDRSTPSRAPSVLTTVSTRTSISSVLPKIMPAARVTMRNLPVPKSYQVAPKLFPVPERSQAPKIIPPPRIIKSMKAATTPKAIAKSTQLPRKSLIAPPLNRTPASSSRVQASSPSKNTSISTRPVMPGTKNAPKAAAAALIKARTDSFAKPIAEAATKAPAQSFKSPTVPGKRVTRLQRPGFTKK